MSSVSELAESVATDHDNPCDVLEGLAQAAEAAERYDDMVVMMQKLVKIKTKDEKELSADQRNLLSVAYKNVVGSKRSSWRMLNDDGQFASGDDAPDPKLLKDYKTIVEAELKQICLQVLGELETLQEQNGKKIKSAEQDAKKAVNECQVFYLKMIGDYYRYLTEAFSSNEEYKKKCDEYYTKAMELAEKELEATHPTRLGLALNYSVCYYEILDEQAKACELAKSAFDEAIEKLDSLNDISYKDSTLIMQLLRDNLTIWNQSSAENTKEEARG